MKTQVTGNIPKPRSGFLGEWDTFVGPGATAAENTWTLFIAVLGMVASFIYQQSLGKSWVQASVGALIALDVFGGAVANASVATKRWYHRPCETCKSHLKFTSLHLLHLALASVLFANDIRYLAYYGTLLMTSAVAIVYTPRYLQNVVANTCLIMVILAWHYGDIPQAVGLEWLIPVLFIKLLTGHLVPETPYEKDSTMERKQE